MRLRRQYLTRNDCYQAGRVIVPRGVMVHSTGADNPRVSRYVPGNELLGRNKGENHWDRPELDKCVHAFVGRFADGEVGIVQTLPWTCRGWHCGKGRLGSANNTHISFELCEDSLDDGDYFRAVYRQGVELTAVLCRMYGLNPMADGVVIGHGEGAKRGIASSHGDPDHWFRRFDRTMDDFRRDVARQMEGDEEMTQGQFDALMADWLRRQGEKPADSWAVQLVEAAQAKGLTDGSRPQSFATRQEVAVMVNAALNTVK